MLLLDSTAIAQNYTVKVKSKGKSYIGKKLEYDGRDMVLLRRDGRISILSISKPSDIAKVSNSFQPYESEIIRRCKINHNASARIGYFNISFR